MELIYYVGLLLAGYMLWQAVVVLLSSYRLWERVLAAVVVWFVVWVLWGLLSLGKYIVVLGG